MAAISLGFGSDIMPRAMQRFRETCMLFGLAVLFRIYDGMMAGWPFDLLRFNSRSELNCFGDGM